MLLFLLFASTNLVVIISKFRLVRDVDSHKAQQRLGPLSALVALFNASNPFNCLRMFLWARVVDRELRAHLFQSGHVRNFFDCYQHIRQRRT